MTRISSGALPWAILLAVVFAAVILYFAAMLEVIEQISRDQDDLERLLRGWLTIEVSMAEEDRQAGPGARIPGRLAEGVFSDVSRFRQELGRILDLPWFLALHRTYPQMRARSDSLRQVVTDLASGLEGPTRSWRSLKDRAKAVEQDLGSLLAWIGLYRNEQMRAFRVLLVFLAASTVLGSVTLLGLGNLIKIQEARFLAAMDSLGDSVILTDAKEEIVYANPAAKALLAANPAGSRRLPAALRDSHLFVGVRNTEPPGDIPKSVETSLLDAKGRRRAVAIVSEAIREPSGRTIGSVYLVRDLTEWRRLVASVETAFSRLQIDDADAAVDRALQEAAVLCGAEASALLLFARSRDFSSEEFPESLRSPRVLPGGLEEWARRTAQDGRAEVLYRTSAPAAEAGLLTAASLGWAAAVPLRLAGAVFGAIVLAGRSAAPQTPPEASIIDTLGMLIVELLSKKWAVNEMNRLGAEYKDLVESASVPIWGVDLERRINEWNNAMSAITGRGKLEAMGLPACSIFQSGPDSAAFERLITAVLDRRHITDQELRVATASGGQVTLLVGGSTRLDGAGRVVGAILIAQDITARIAAELRVKEQARALVGVQEIERLRISRDLHDGVAQDLSAARISCETLFDGAAVDEPQLRGRVARIEASISSALQTIRTIAYDLRPVETGPLPIADAIGRVCSSFRGPRPLSVTFKAAGTEGLSLSAERTANLCRILQEALSNAARHSGAHRVEVTLVSSHPDLILRIVDDGTGFDVERSFADAVERRRMGLLGIRERAVVLGGAISITSRSGRGTQVRLAVPVVSSKDS